MTTFRSITTGPEDAPALVFVHGFMGCAGDFEAAAARLDDRLRCIRVDLPGHGDGPPLARTLSLPRLADGLRAEVLEPLASRGERPTLVGYSMGGRLALQAALDHPEAVGELVLASTSPGIADEKLRAERRAQDRRRAASIRDDYAAFLRGWYRLPIFGDLAQAPGYRAMLRRRLQNDPEMMARVVVELSPGRQPSNWHRLDRLERASWLVGAQDPKYRDLGSQLRERGHRVVAAPGAAHALHVEEPTWFADQIARLGL